MAAESLENKAREMGITIKVETNGSGGAKNVLTAKEIRAAKGIIVAADKNVEMQRFYGKRVLQVPVADGFASRRCCLGRFCRAKHLFTARARMWKWRTAERKSAAEGRRSIVI